MLERILQSGVHLNNRDPMARNRIIMTDSDAMNDMVSVILKIRLIMFSFLRIGEIESPKIRDGL